MSARRAGSLRFDHGAQYFTVRDARFREWVDRWQERGIVAPWTGRIVALGDGGAHPAGEDTRRHVGVPGMNAPVKDLANDLSVETGIIIENLERVNSRWVPVDDSGRKHGPFDQLVLALAPEQAVPLLESRSPDLTRLASSVRSSPCWAVMASFEERLPLDFDGAFIHDCEELAWVARNSSKPGREPVETWVLHATPAWSASRLEASRDEVARELLEGFFRRVELRPRAPDVRLAHRWKLARVESPLQVGFGRDPGASLGICGDWLAGCRVEGAFLSGLGLARDLIRSGPEPEGELS